MKFNGFKVGDVVRPHTNDTYNIDYVTTGSTYTIVRLYIQDGIERMDIDDTDYKDAHYTMEQPQDFTKVCKSCGH